MKTKYRDNNNRTIESLLLLTEAFFYKILKEYSFLSYEEKISFIKDTLENRALKQNMDYIKERVFFSTVHGAKGLEWDNVILPDMEAYVFPTYSSLCRYCDFKTGRKIEGSKCKIQLHNHELNYFLEELSVFYVAVTRARKNVFFFASAQRYNNNREKKNGNISCLLSLPGIEI